MTEPTQPSQVVTARPALYRADRVSEFSALTAQMMQLSQPPKGAVSVYDADGQLISATFNDYAMPRADDFPSFDFQTRNVPCKWNPLGIKGAGEAGTIGATPAVMNAVVDALNRAYGIRNIDMPATPLRVWEAIRAAKE